jgi:hypothetical protein
MRWRAGLKFNSLASHTQMLAGVALSTTVLGVYFALAGPMKGHSHIGSPPTDAVCPRDTYGYKAKPLAACGADGFAVFARAARS